MIAEKPRQIAARILRGREGGQERVERLLETELERVGRALSPPDRGLTQELAFGVVRWQRTLDWLIARKTAGRSQKAGLQTLLRLGLYQMFWLDRIPDHAAVHETVELARELGFGPQAGFVNAVLRGCLRERAVLEKQLRDLKLTSPALGHSHPDWLCARWEKRWGPEKLQALLEWNNTPAVTFGRVNGLMTTPEALAARFEAEGVLFTPREYDWTRDATGRQPVGIFELRSHPPLASLPSFQQGLFYVQDPSTLLGPLLLGPQPGETLLDLCAAPGGKTTLLAQLMENRGNILAHDIDATRLERVRENCARLGVRCVTLARDLAAGSRFNRILVDVPCSNTGVMRRRVELRWRVQPAELERLKRLQIGLLLRAAAHLQPGGTMVYSTCSLEPEENEEVVRDFLSARPDFRLERERQLLPFVECVDGAFVAVLRPG